MLILSQLRRYPHVGTGDLTHIGSRNRDVLLHLLTPFGRKLRRTSNILGARVYAYSYVHADYHNFGIY